MEEEKEENKMMFWIDGEYEAVGGFFIRNGLKDFLNLIKESGKEPVGIVVDFESNNLEVIVKKFED